MTATGSSSGLHSQNPWAGAQSGPLHASTPLRGALIRMPMSECKHLLPPSQCSLCLGTVEDVVEEAHERKDYAQLELTESFTITDKGTVFTDIHRQMYPNGEQFTDHVEPYEIYGTKNPAPRLGRKVG